MAEEWHLSRGKKVSCVLLLVPRLFLQIGIGYALYVFSFGLLLFGPLMAVLVVAVLWWAIETSRLLITFHRLFIQGELFVQLKFDQGILIVKFPGRNPMPIQKKDCRSLHLKTCSLVLEDGRTVRLLPAPSTMLWSQATPVPRWLGSWWPTLADAVVESSVQRSELRRGWATLAIFYMTLVPKQA